PDASSMQPANPDSAARIHGGRASALRAVIAPTGAPATSARPWVPPTTLQPTTTPAATSAATPPATRRVPSPARPAGPAAGGAAILRFFSPAMKARTSGGTSGLDSAPMWASSISEAAQVVSPPQSAQVCSGGVANLRTSKCSSTSMVCAAVAPQRGQLYGMVNDT